MTFLPTSSEIIGRYLRTVRGATECCADQLVDILSTEIASQAFKALVNSELGTKWVLVPATYTPPRGSTELEFCIRDGVVGPRTDISRVLCPLRDGDHLSGMPVARHL